MSFPIGATYRAIFPTKIAGELADADSLPTGVLRVNGSDTAVTVTVTKLSTGIYEASCSLAGRSNGDIFEVIISATIDGKDDEQSMGTEIIDATTSSRSTFDPDTDTVARVTLVDTTTTNSDMRGTDGAYTGTPPDATAIQNAAAAALNAYDPPTKAEMDARTIASASYATSSGQATLGTKLDTLLSRITSTLFEGMDSLPDWLRCIVRKDAGSHAALSFTLSDINAARDDTTGTYDPTTDSIEAIRDRGDAAWTGGGSSGPTAEQIRQEIDSNSTRLAAIQNKTDQLTFTSGSVDANTTHVAGEEAVPVEPLTIQQDAEGYVLARNEDGEKLAAEATAEAAKAAAEANKATLEAMTEDDEGTPRFTANALEQAPTGGGGGGGGLTPEQDEKLDLLVARTAGEIEQSSNVLANGREIVTYQGDDYTVGSPRGAYEWAPDNDADWPDLTGASVKFTSRNVRGSIDLSVEGEVVNPAGPGKMIRVEMTSAQTAKLTPTPRKARPGEDLRNRFDVEVTLSSGEIWTPVFSSRREEGGHEIIEDQTRQ